MLPLFRKRCILMTTTLRSRSAEYIEDLQKQFLDRCNDGFENGDLRVIIDKTFKMTELVQAMKHVADNKSMGKVVIQNDFHGLEEMNRQWNYKKHSA